MGLTTADLALRVAHWRLRAEAAERALADLGVTPEEARAGAARSKANQRDAERYQLLRRGQHWSVIDGIGDTLRGEEMDAAIDAKLALHNVAGNRIDPACRGNSG